MSVASAGAWVLLPQAVSRLAALFVFAVAANRLDVRELGVLAIGTAAGAAAFGVVPAIVAKPMAALNGAAARQQRAPMAESAAVLLSLPVAAVLGLAALAFDDLTRVALIACAIAVPAATIVEARYWRSVFISGRRRAGLVLSAAFVVQTASVTVAALWLGETAVMLSPFTGLALAAAVLLARPGAFSARGARAWLTEHRSTWLPFVWGVSASVLLVQAIPVLLTALVGLAAASVYRGVELLFGATNLAIGVVARALLTEDVADPRRVYVRSVVPLAALSLTNGAVLWLVPSSWLAVVIGPVTGLLTLAVVVAFTLQRVLHGAVYVGQTLLLRLLSARRIGALEAGNAALHIALLFVGAGLLGVAGGIGGLAVAELVAAVVFLVLLWRATAADRARRTGAVDDRPEGSPSS